VRILKQFKGLNPDMAEDRPLTQDPLLPDEDSPAQASERPSTLEDQLADARAKAEHHREAWMRALAEADNIRKRSQVELANAHKFAVERFAESLLPVVDSLEAAIATGAATLEAVRGGVELTIRQLRSSFDKAGLKEIAPAPGARFDPHHHQAMAAVESDAEPNSVVATLQKGWSLNERVLRPALVTVAKARAAPESPAANDPS